jgi:hypothetical protein
VGTLRSQATDRLWPPAARWGSRYRSFIANTLASRVWDGSRPEAVIGIAQKRTSEFAEADTLLLAVALYFVDES